MKEFKIGPTCGKCGGVMTPENAKIRPELFLHDKCLPEEFQRAWSSARHPHEPEIPPSIDSDGRCRVCRLLVENDTLRTGLDRLVALYGHYAELLNQYDGGTRIRFNSGQEWLDRLSELKAKADKEIPG